MVLVAIYLAGARRWKSQAFVIVGPMLFGIGGILSTGSPFGGRKLPGADDFVGYYVLELTAACFAFHVTRLGSLGSWRGMNCYPSRQI